MISIPPGMRMFSLRFFCKSFHSFTDAQQTQRQTLPHGICLPFSVNTAVLPVLSHPCISCPCAWREAGQWSQGSSVEISVFFIVHLSCCGVMDTTGAVMPVLKGQSHTLWKENENVREIPVAWSLPASVPHLSHSKWVCVFHGQHNPLLLLQFFVMIPIQHCLCNRQLWFF